MVRNQARTSCDLPGMKRKIFGRRRRSAICRAPLSAEGARVPRSFFRSAIAPEAGFAMSRSPMRVSETIWRSATMPTIASQASRRARSAGRIACTCSSRKRRLAITMSARATSATAAASVAGRSAQSAAAWTLTARPGNSGARRAVTRSAGPAVCASRVTMTMR